MAWWCILSFLVSFLLSLISSLPIATECKNISSRYLLVQSQQSKQQNNVCNMFKVNKKDTRGTSTTPFWCLYCQLRTYFTHCSGVSVLEFKQIMANYVRAVILRWHFEVYVWQKYFQMLHWQKCISEVVSQRCSVKMVFLEISQNSQENASARVSFLIKWQNF